ncbi:NADP-dependent succinic semialdehyde dehydrogenase [Frankia sp. AgB1.9]|uniref:NADP-dependent succinic semialdehyde dehydrogenase n=1 Tax=unclassified Frankia TaxID=2632575 RepID=UPI0019317724|nr:MULTISPECIES: NADP-dependent succinic semialdehyde dehydrogenase [unclassified Frankia]MBL7492184.1 NADP-dependent succinic semialdehyde dehydrogenase [Frankia sp. AgW1.1]MBL7552124.1 NADP-dependent succinic semialdehyde dehydrogenase [Frankia sp. AgB1.9]MBL7622157.1 NADP-dependent succinic semialdehyde dehydrogenase [Frankia sp. AgB1.8]
MAIQSINPATGAVLKTFDPLGPDEIEAKLARAATTFASYRRTTFAERAGKLRAAADLLDAERRDIAVTMTSEMGKTVASAAAEAAKCAKAMRFYAEHAEGFLADEPLEDPSVVGARRAFARYQPIGAVLAVMPWNFPLWQVTRFAAPALMAGNVGLLKHSSNVPQCALYLEDLFTRAGFPVGAFQTLLISARQVEAVLRDPRVAAATVTGSEPAGQSVAAICGDEIKKTVLELGGSDAFVVMPSADLEKAASVAVTARCQNNGQSCIAAKRFIVHDAVYDEFAGLFAAKMAALRVGDPLADGTDIGPIATEQGRTDLEELLADAVAKGATVLCGGTAPDGPGWFFPPTVVADVTPAMRLYLEETFGPVATLYRAADLDGAVEIANATSFGLSSNAWTTDPAEQELFANELVAGAVFINGMTTSYPELPFGGVRRSGYGRELGAVGIREFCNQKTVWMG